MRRITWFVVGLVLVLALASCGPSAAPTATPVPPTAVPPTAVPAQPTSAPSGTTAAEIAARGKQVYAQNCSRCHDGAVGSLESGYRRFADAGAMLSFAKSNMPQGNPGSLKPDEYFAVIVNVLVSQKLVAPDAVLDASTLSAIKF